MMASKVNRCLKAVYGLQDDYVRVALSAIATAMRVKPPTVTETLQWMHDGFVSIDGSEQISEVQ